jgi:cytochrome c biogenesis protein CcmG/thiol:disulfide interchange protein DsbE
MQKIVFVSLILFLSSFVKANNSDTAKSNTLPAISVKDMNGQSVNFNEFVGTGQITVISFFATWCKPCLVELNNIDALYSEWQEKYKMKLVAVSVDDSRTSNKVKGMVTSKGWTYDVLIDLNGDLRRALNVTNPPTTFLIDKNGKIVYTHTGYLEGDELELEKKIAELAAN